jgi:hypothetical protein
MDATYHGDLMLPPTNAIVDVAEPSVLVTQDVVNRMLQLTTTAVQNGNDDGAKFAGRVKLVTRDQSGFGLQIEDVKEKLALSERTAQAIRVLKKTEFIGSIVLLAGGLGCVIVDRVVAAVEGNSTLQTLGTALITAAITLFTAGPVQNTIIDKLKQ